MSIIVLILSKNFNGIDMFTVTEAELFSSYHFIVICGAFQLSI